MHLLWVAAYQSEVVHLLACGGGSCFDSMKSSEMAVIPVFQVEFSHIGTYKLKGVADNQTVMQINSSTLTNRRFPSKPASGKAEIVSPCCPFSRC